MSNMAIRMTVDVCVFEGTAGERLMKAILKDGSGGQVTVPTEDGKAIERVKLHPFGIGEREARKVFDAISRGDIEIDDVRDIEDHSR